LNFFSFTSAEIPVPYRGSDFHTVMKKSRAGAMNECAGLG
jgi:hypothetical protein